MIILYVPQGAVSDLRMCYHHQHHIQGFHETTDQFNLHIFFISDGTFQSWVLKLAACNVGNFNKQY